jgi:hypothetical protein
LDTFLELAYSTLVGFNGLRFNRGIAGAPCFAQAKRGIQEKSGDQEIGSSGDLKTSAAPVAPQCLRQQGTQEIGDRITADRLK